MSIKDELGGRTLAELGEVMAPPKPRSWADVEERADEVRAAIAAGVPVHEQTGTAVDEPRVEVEGDTLPADTPAVYLHEHRNKRGRVVTSWFARR